MVISKVLSRSELLAQRKGETGANRRGGVSDLESPVQIFKWGRGHITHLKTEISC